MSTQTTSTWPFFGPRLDLGRSRSPGPVAPLPLFWATFVIAVLAFIIRGSVAELPQAIDFTLAAMSAGTCGLAWLFSRSLFSDEPRTSLWPIGLVALLFASGIGLMVAGNYSETTALRYVDSLHGMIGSAMLVLIALEPMGASSSDTSKKRLRTAFLSAYVMILAMALIARLPEAAAWQDRIQIGLATIAMFGATAALVYQRHSKQASACEATSARRSPETVGDPELAQRLVECLESESLYRRPGLKVSDLARRLNVQDYKVSQTIVHDLGHANFNRLINVYRIAEAKSRLCDAREADTSILSISLDCGFNSLGPFNRAFKAETGMTPTRFRQAATARTGPAQKSVST